MPGARELNAGRSKSVGEMAEAGQALECRIGGGGDPWMETAARTPAGRQGAI